jgi:hypothetical protein
MRNLTRQIVAAALLLGIVGTPPSAEPQTHTAKKERTGSLSGRVTIKGKGAHGVVVSLSKNESSPPSAPPYRDSTDDDGKYRITGVPPGNYRVVALAPALVLTDVGSFGATVKSLSIAEGEAVEGLDFALVRGGVITGRVTDADGRPVIEERVDVISADPSIWRPHSPMGFQTDDRGIYRIFGIPSGRYRVAMGLSEGSSFMSGDTGRPLYKQTFYPDVNDPSSDLRRPDQVEARGKLRRDAEAGRKVIELRDCQNVSDYQLQFYSAAQDRLLLQKIECPHNSTSLKSSY